MDKNSQSLRRIPACAIPVKSSFVQPFLVFLLEVEPKRNCLPCKSVGYSGNCGMRIHPARPNFTVTPSHAGFGSKSTAAWMSSQNASQCQDRMLNIIWSTMDAYHANQVLVPTACFKPSSKHRDAQPVSRMCVGRTL